MVRRWVFIDCCSGIIRNQEDDLHEEIEGVDRLED